MTVLLLLTLTDDIEAHSVLRFFKGRGYEVDFARSGPECAAKLRDLAPDVFAPNPGPGGGGDDAATSDAAAAPFLFIVGEAGGGDLSPLAPAANTRCLETPVELRTLLETVRSLQTYARSARAERSSCCKAEN
jgi:hypothetical protein